MGLKANRKLPSVPNNHINMIPFRQETERTCARENEREDRLTR